MTEITLFDGDLTNVEAQLMVDYDPHGDTPPLYAFVRREPKADDWWLFWGASAGADKLTEADARLWAQHGCSAAVRAFLEEHGITNAHEI